MQCGLRHKSQCSVIDSTKLNKGLVQELYSMVPMNTAFNYSGARELFSAGCQRVNLFSKTLKRLRILLTGVKT